MASGFSQLKSDMPPGGGIQEDFRTEKKGLVIKKVFGFDVFDKASQSHENS